PRTDPHRLAHRPSDLRSLTASAAIEAPSPLGRATRATTGRNPIMEILSPTPEADNEVVARHTFAPGVSLLTVDWPNGRHAATLVLEVDRDVTADELRALAAQYEAFPAWLRTRADEQDARS